MSLPSISNLMSPPEAKPLESFSITPSKSPSATQPRAYSSEQKLAPMASHAMPDSNIRILPSPPISPWMSKVCQEEKIDQTRSTCGKQGRDDGQDPVLFPDSESVGSVSDQPLFSAEASIENTEDIITNHIAMHLQRFNHKVNCPTREEYRLAIACVPQIGRLYNQNPAAYMKRQREEMEDEYWQTKRFCATAGTKTAPVRIAPAPRSIKRPIHRASTPAKATLLAKAAIPRIKRTPKASPMTKLMGFPEKGRSATPDRTPGTKREDVDYDVLPDYAPPTSTLPKGNPKILKADWPSSNILNLANDPDRDVLHEAELNLAGTLRLSCATYLCSKRRIFESRLNALKIGKEFRKTDAQQACKIDVNKASKLWGAYDKVGWFDKKYFIQYL